MSKFVPATIRCQCGADYAVEVAESLHATRVPERREQILAGTFHVFPCPSCGRDNAVEKLFIYLDFSAKHWLSVFPEPAVFERQAYEELDQNSFDQTMLERSPEMVKAWAPQFVRRVVCGRAGLREKLVIFDAGLDDRLIEVMKLDVLRANGLPLTPTVRFNLVERRPRSLLFMYAAAPEDTPAELELPLADYARMVSGFDRYQPAIDELFGSGFVDFRVALR